jgi:hypothetical protein
VSEVGEEFVAALKCHIALKFHELFETSQVAKCAWNS